YAKAQTIWSSRMVVRNPSYGKHPQLKPERLPATRHVGEMDFTLESMNVEQLYYAGNVHEYFRTAHISTRVTERGQATDAWEGSSLAVADATGNSTEHLDRYFWKANHWCWPAMPGEDAVKLRVEFVKTNGFGSNDLFVLRGVPMLPLPPWRFTTNIPAGR